MLSKKIVSRGLTYLVGALLALVSLAGCSNAIYSTVAAYINAGVPHEGYRVTEDIAYGAEARQKLDIYVPEHAANAAPLPVVVFFYGGSWKFGSKNDYLFVGQALASQGFIAVLPDYRIYPPATYPSFVEDSAAAVKWAHDHVAEYGGDARNLFVAGHSAGGYNAMMVASNEKFLSGAGLQESDIRGVLGLAGPYDFLPLTDDDLKIVFHGDRNAESQPITYVTHKMPPVFLAWGDADDVVGRRNLDNVAAKLRALHSPVETKIYPGVGHIGIIAALADGRRDKAPLLADMVAFMRGVMGK